LKIVHQRSRAQTASKPISKQKKVIRTANSVDSHSEQKIGFDIRPANSKSGINSHSELVSHEIDQNVIRPANTLKGYQVVEGDREHAQVCLRCEGEGCKYCASRPST
jgi:hypothetical protein